MPTLSPSDTWQLGNPYERYVGRWSRRVARPFIAWLWVPPGKHWLDTGCGTRALSAAILAHAAPASLTGIEPSEGFLKVASEALPSRVTLLPGNAASVPLPDDSVDVIVSGLVLNFVPDLNTAFAEITRVATKGATVGAYVWDYAGKMELMRHFWDAAVELDPGAAKLDEGLRFPMCHEDALRALFAGAGLHDVRTMAIDIETPFGSFEDYWEPFLGGQGPAPAYAMSLEAGARDRLRDAVRARLPIRSDGTIPLIARAWAVRATV